MVLPKIIAHRGGREWAPENTLAAFRLALELGVDGMEFDVQRCSTGELVVFHDEGLGRTTNGVGLIKDCSFDELRRLDAGSWFDREFKGERIPLLSEVLELVGGKCKLHIELKNAPVDYPGIEDDLLIAIEGYPAETLVISSFDHKLLFALHQLEPSLEKAMLGEAIFMDLAELATKIGATCFDAAIDSLRADVVEEAHNAGIRVNAWTANTAQKWRECVRWQVDGIITDDPEGLTEYISKIEAARNG